MMEKIPLGSTPKHRYCGDADHLSALRAELCFRIRMGNGLVVFDHSGLELLFTGQFAEENGRLSSVRQLARHSDYRINLLKMMGRQGFEQFIAERLPSARQMIHTLAMAIYDHMATIDAIAKERPIPVGIAEVVPPFSFEGLDIWMAKRLEPKKQTSFLPEIRFLEEVEKRKQHNGTEQTDTLHIMGCCESKELTHPIVRAALIQLRHAIEPLVSIPAFNATEPSIAYGPLCGDGIVVVGVRTLGHLATSLLFKTLVAMGANRTRSRENFALSIVSAHADGLIGPDDPIAARSLLVRKVELVLGAEGSFDQAIGHAELKTMCQTFQTPQEAAYYTDEKAPKSRLWLEIDGQSRSRRSVQTLKEELLALRNRTNQIKGVSHESRI